MKKVQLQNTSLNVSALCFGTGRISNLSTRDGAKLLKEAYKKGINFWDTSDNYDSHRHVKLALKGLPRRKVVIMSKISNYFVKAKIMDYVDNMLRELGTTYLDLLLLHAVDTEEELRKYLGLIYQLKKTGKIRHIGISSHKSHIIRKIASNIDIEFVLAPYNYRGFRIAGSYRDISHATRRRKMANALRLCKKNGKDIYLIKIFAAGKIRNIEKAVKYGLSQKFADGIDLGITTASELNQDVKIVNMYS